MKIHTLIVSLLLSLGASAQSFSDQIELLNQNGEQITVQATAVAEKKKEAQDLAVKSAFNALFHSGIEGIKNATPMVATKRSDYDYRLFSENRYLNYIVGEIKQSGAQKIGGKQRVSVTITLNLAGIKRDLAKNNITLNPVWADAKKAGPTASLKPTIVVVPYTRASEGYSFEAMRRKVENSDFQRYTISAVMDCFNGNGYKTRDFVTQLMNSKTSDLLRGGAQTDDATMVAQQLPGDIIVYVDASIKRNEKGSSAVALGLKAIEQQTAGDLASKTYNSGFYMTSDSVVLVNDAVKKIEKEFFSRLQTAFEQMIANGREIALEFNLGATASDWDFDMESPVTGEYFKDALEDWLREKAMNQTYDIKANTAKFVNASVNVPLWNYERNRAYSLSNFSGDLRKFLKAQLGDDYKSTVTALGQKIVVTIE